MLKELVVLHIILTYTLIVTFSITIGFLIYNKKTNIFKTGNKGLQLEYKIKSIKGTVANNKIIMDKIMSKNAITCIFIYFIVTILLLIVVYWTDFLLISNLVANIVNEIKIIIHSMCLLPYSFYLVIYKVLIIL